MGRVTPWIGRPGALIARFNGDWLLIRRWLEAHPHGCAAPPGLAGGAPHSAPPPPPPAGWFAPPGRVAVAPDLY